MIVRVALRDKRVRRLVLIALLIGLLALLYRQREMLYGQGVGPIGTVDFMEYWVAGRLVLEGGNPYDGGAVLALQRELGWPQPDPVRMWNPPWTLPVVLVLALLPFGFAALVWFLTQLGLVLASGLLLWRYFEPGDTRYWIGAVLAAAFLPTVTALSWGQIGPWMLAGTVGFLCAERRGRDLLAGASLALLMIKPHIAYLLWIAALWWAWQYRRPKVIAGWLLALAGASGLVLAFAPDVFANYLEAASNPPLHWATPTLGFWLRAIIGVDPHWVQYVPFVAGGVGLFVWLLRRRGEWRWPTLVGPLLLISLLLAPHAWTYDCVVLLPAIAAMVSNALKRPLARRVALLSALAISQLALILQNPWKVGDVYSVWHVPVLAGLYWLSSAGVGDGAVLQSEAE